MRGLAGLEISVVHLYSQPEQTDGEESTGTGSQELEKGLHFVFPPSPYSRSNAVRNCLPCTFSFPCLPQYRTSMTCPLLRNACTVSLITSRSESYIRAKVLQS